MQFERNKLILLGSDSDQRHTGLEYDGQKYIVISDYITDGHFEKVIGYKNWFLKRIEVAQKFQAHVLIVTNLQSRADYYEFILGKNHVMNLSRLNQAKSYRFRFEIDKTREKSLQKL